MLMSNFLSTLGSVGKSFGSVIGAVSGLGGLFSNLFGNSRNDEWNRRNYELALRQQNFQEESFRKQMKFNSPVTQANLLRAANLNPALMSSGLAGSISSGSSAGLPGSIPYQPLDLNGLSSLSRGITLNDAEKDKTRSEVHLNHIKSIGDEFNNFLLQTYGEAIKKGQLDESISRCQKNFNEALLALAQGDDTRAHEKLNRAMEFASYASGGRDDAERNFIESEIRWYGEKVRAQIAALRASAYRDTKEGDVSSLEYKIKSDSDVIDAIRQSYIDTSNKLQQENKLSKKQADMIDELIRKYQQENDTYYLKLALDYIDGWIQTGAQIFGLRTKVGAIASIAESSKRNVDLKQQKQEFEQNSYSTTNVYDGKGRLKSTTQHRRRRR